MNRKEMDLIQDRIGYRFKNIDLLQQAFTRRTYSQENGGGDNEVLEFIGDKVLEFAVVKRLTERFGAFCHEYADFRPSEECDEFISLYQEDRLTELKQQLVEKKTLSYRIDRLDLAGFLILGKGDIHENVGAISSVKEDLFEAILGAVALDADWDTAAVETTVDVMLEPEHTIGGGDDAAEQLREWFLKKKKGVPEWHFTRGVQDAWYAPFTGISGECGKDSVYACLLRLSDDLPLFRAFGRTGREARARVCSLACQTLRQKGLMTDAEAAEEIEAVGVLETLARRRRFALPEYSFEQKAAPDKSALWGCTCRIGKRVWTAQATAKRSAKKAAAQAALSDWR